MAKQRSHISIRTISLLMFAVAVCVLGGALFAGSYYSDTFNTTQEAYNASVICRQSARDIQLASDFLTRKAQSFVLTADDEDALAYLTELTVTRRRDIAVERVTDNTDIAEEEQLVTDAKASSDYLVGLELYAIRLVCEAEGIDPGSLSAQVSDVSLSASDSALSASGKESRAIELLFGEDYRTHKDTVDNSLSAALDLIRVRVSDNNDAMNAAFKDLRRFQSLVAFGTAALILLLLIWIFRLVISPLQKYVASIKRGEKINPRGAAELQTLAASYNKMFEENASRHKELTDQASTDALTGVNNRLVFERLCLQRMLGTQKALMLVDIDYFKHVNDQYGHDTGDRILQKVARVLTENVRGEDVVCRIGGDEFVVIMQRIRPDRSIQIEAKIDRITSMLRNTDDGLPAVTLSIGIAFGDGDCPVGNLHKHADLALYEVKENGRNGHRFYADGAASNGSEDEDIPDYDDRKEETAETEDTAEQPEAGET